VVAPRTGQNPALNTGPDECEGSRPVLHDQIVFLASLSEPVDLAVDPEEQLVAQLADRLRHRVDSFGVMTH
jgi:hypothetical protein